MPPNPNKMWGIEVAVAKRSSAIHPVEDVELQEESSCAADEDVPPETASSLVTSLQAQCDALTDHLRRIKAEIGAIRLKGTMAQHFLTNSPSEAANGIRQVVEAVSSLELNLNSGKEGGTLSNKVLPGLEGGIAGAKKMQALVRQLDALVQSNV